MGITYEHVEQYLVEMQEDRDPLMQEMESYAQDHGVPIIGPVAGQFLYAIAKIHRSQRVLEAGTAIGYTAIWFARAIRDWGGTVTTLEKDQDMASLARKNLVREGVEDRVEVVLGDALTSLESLQGPFDLIFLDHAKQQYQPFLSAALPKLVSGGVLLADNVLRGGSVAEEGSKDDMVQAMRSFNEYISQVSSLESMIIPLRDGISLAIKY